MKKLLLLFSVLTLAFCAQADVISIQNANYRHVKNHQVFKPAISQADAEALQANQSENGQLFDYRVGIQAHYTIDGVKNSSDIVYLDVYPMPSEASEVVTGKQIANVRYFNLAGQEMAQPSGMTIQVTTYTDGTTTAAKVIK